MSIAPSPLMQDLIRLALAAGREIMAIYATDFSAKAKEDLTPVTEADEASEKIILSGLARIDASTPVISEEPPRRTDTRSLGALLSGRPP